MIKFRGCILAVNLGLENAEVVVKIGKRKSHRFGRTSLTSSFNLKQQGPYINRNENDTTFFFSLGQKLTERHI